MRLSLTPREKRILKRGASDIKATVVGGLSGFLATGGDFIANPKGAVVFVVTSALSAMNDRRHKEALDEALRTPPPEGG